MVSFRGSGLLGKALGEGFWCPQVGGSKHSCDTGTRERVSLAGPSGLGVPQDPLCDAARLLPLNYGKKRV